MQIRSTMLVITVIELNAPVYWSEHESGGRINSTIGKSDLKTNARVEFLKIETTYHCWLYLGEPLCLGIRHYCYITCQMCLSQLTINIFRNISTSQFVSK